MGNVSQSSSTDERRRRPTAVSRFLKRAETIKTDSAYLEELRHCRAAWNASFPAFAIGKHEARPEVESLMWGYTYLPFALAQGDPQYGSDAADARMQWMELIRRLCDVGWPPTYYSNWFGKSLHPAMPFVSACLVWGVDSADEDDIIGEGLTPRALNYDPDDEDAAPAAVAWRVRHESLLRQLREMVSTGDPISSETLEAADRVAMIEASKASYAAMSFEPAAWYWYLPLPPGTTSSDLRAAERACVEAAAKREGPHPPQEHASRLYSESMSKRKIARLLGVEPKTIREWLRSDDA